VYLICDCDNFYASCERVFNPAVKGKPVVILSNNDGCVIARSNEAKKLGYKMGDPFFKVKDKLEQDGVAVFSSNYNLYGDMSRRVMQLLSSYSPDFWQYSIDEGFLGLHGFEIKAETEGKSLSEYLHEYGLDIQKTITRGTGIPVTIGIAPTKTLAKMASKFGKKYPGYKHVCMIDTEEKREKALKLFPVEDVWGIGRRSHAKLEYYGVHTAWDLTQKSEAWVRKQLMLPGVKTWMELRGFDCISVDELPEKKSICTSRSFADKGISKVADLEEALANFTSSCAIKLQKQHTVCQNITIFCHTSPFAKEYEPARYIYRTLTLPVATNAQTELVGYAMQMLRSEYIPDDVYRFKKAGCIVWEITRDDAIQTDLFDTVDREKQRRLIEAVAEVNRKNGHNMLQLAIQGVGKKWHLKHEMKSAQFTTNVLDIIKVK